MISAPYTHADHFEACRTAAERGEVLHAWVQVKTCQTALCAEVVEPWTASNGMQFWKLRVDAPLRHIGHYPVHAVRRCSGVDARCYCACEGVALAESVQGVV